MVGMFHLMDGVFLHGLGCGIIPQLQTFCSSRGFFLKNIKTWLQTFLKPAATDLYKYKFTCIRAQTKTSRQRRCKHEKVRQRQRRQLLSWQW